MTRKEVIQCLRARGFRVAPHTVQNAIDYAQIPEAEFDGAGNRIFTTEHIEKLAAMLQRKGQVATA